MFSNYRPWGHIDFVLKHSDIHKSKFIGCLSVESRCVESAKSILDKELDVDFDFFLINDPINDAPDITRQKLDSSREALEGDLGITSSIDEFNLLCPPFDISDYFIKSIEGYDSIILDITCMPKRFFFIAVKEIIGANVSNFMVTYCRPEGYCDREELSGNPGDLEALPFFGKGVSADKQKNFLLSIGHSELGLIGAIEKKAKSLNLHVLFPFPPGSPNFEKNWRFMESIQKLDFANKPVDPIRVSASNISDAFDHMMNISPGLKEPLMLAPYGPKPMSLAMCLFAIYTESEVVYTQPSSYSPNYSHGYAVTDDGKPSVMAYWINLNGKNLYFEKA